MNTPIWDFLRNYQNSGTARFHMPGHKGVSQLGFESFDLTEITGADSLYEASGIIGESEANASALFHSRSTFYSAEGSSLCIRAMLYLLTMHRLPGTSRCILAARNVHKSFIYAAALLDIPVIWLYPDRSSSICSCPISPDNLAQALQALSEPPAAVFLTSPDYLGGVADIQALSSVCHQHGTRLAVDNAHGAYLHFLPVPSHPLDLGADICCDSAHKTLPVLTGGAYLHFSGQCEEEMISDARKALSLFGSTSPSYLILASLDRCNALLTDSFPSRLEAFLPELDRTRAMLAEQGCSLLPSDPLRITLSCDGFLAAALLQRAGGEMEYSDRNHLVLMLSPYNSAADLEILERALAQAPKSSSQIELPVLRAPQKLTLREALMNNCDRIPVTAAIGRVCADLSVSCPPAIPILMPGEVITAEAVKCFHIYGKDSICVVAE